MEPSGIEPLSASGINVPLVHRLRCLDPDTGSQFCPKLARGLRLRLN